LGEGSGGGSGRKAFNAFDGVKSRRKSGRRGKRKGEQKKGETLLYGKGKPWETA